MYPKAPRHMHRLNSNKFPDHCPLPCNLCELITNILNLHNLFEQLKNAVILINLNKREDLRPNGHTDYMVINTKEMDRDPYIFLNQSGDAQHIISVSLNMYLAYWEILMSEQQIVSEIVT